MVRVEDKGSRFDAPIEEVWRYHTEGADDHARAHTTTRNIEIRAVSDSTFEMASEALIDGRWEKDVTRFTALPPLGMVAEVLEGPLAGSKMFTIYSAHGDQTQIDIVGEFASPSIPPGRLEEVVRAALDVWFAEDAPVLRARAHGKGKDPGPSPAGHRH